VMWNLRYQYLISCQNKW